MKRSYLSYLLRIWQTNSEPPTWVASLEDPHTHKVIQLNSLEALLPFLKQILKQKYSNESSGDEMKNHPDL